METTTTNHPIEIGTIFEYSWGWDQTNVDYFEVVARTAKTVKIRKIGASSVPDSEGFMSDRCVPVPGRFVSDEVLTKRPYLSTWRSDPADHEWMLTFDYGVASVVKPGEATYRSWYA